jgi:protein transport protein SEC24
MMQQPLQQNGPMPSQFNQFGPAQPPPQLQQQQFQGQHFVPPPGAPMQAPQQQQYGYSGMNQQFQHNVNLLGMPTDTELLNTSANELALKDTIYGGTFKNVVHCPPSLQRSTLKVIPQSYATLNKAKLPFGLLLNPFKPLAEDEVIPVVGSTDRKDFNQPVYAAGGICRCRRCRAYINPYIEYVDTTHWRCNVCYLVNEIPTHFDFDTQTQQYVDRSLRPELSYACVEYIATNEYMVRAPVPAVYIFVLDVSYSSVSTGVVDSFCQSLLNSLDYIPDDEGRVRVAFITADSSVHFFHLSPDSEEPVEYVVSDLEDIFLPMPSDLMVILNDSRKQIETLLQSLPNIYKNTTDNQSAVGAALQAAFKMAGPIGGKVILLSATMPSLGPGQLKQREDNKLFGTAQENTLLQPQSSFFKSFAIDCSRSQVCVDMFLFGNAYMDLTTLTGASRFTGGSMYYYPGFNSSRVEDSLKFSDEFGTFIGQGVGLEAVLRVRASKGVRSDAFHGNFFVRSSDLLALPNVNPFNSYGFQMTIDETLQGPYCVFQSALLYTTHFGERRIRVITSAQPVSDDLGLIYRNVDQVALASMLSKMAVERALTAKLEDAREAVVNKILDIFTVYKQTALSQGAQTGLVICENLKLFVVLCLGLIKNEAIKGGSNTPSDMRTHAMSLVRTMPPELCSLVLYPNLYEMHNIPPEVGLDSEDGILLPPSIPLSSERFVRHGVYLMDAGTHLLIWVSREVHPQLVKDLFDRQYEDLPAGKVTNSIPTSHFILD